MLRHWQSLGATLVPIHYMHSLLHHIRALQTWNARHGLDWMQKYKPGFSDFLDFYGWGFFFYVALVAFLQTSSTGVHSPASATALQLTSPSSIHVDLTPFRLINMIFVKYLKQTTPPNLHTILQMHLSATVLKLTHLEKQTHHIHHSLLTVGRHNSNTAWEC